MKKRICLLAALLLAFTMSFECYAQSALRFTDVKETSWYYKDLVELVSKGIIDGFPDNTFKGTSQLNKDQLLKLLITTVNPRGNYDKTSEETWFTPYYRQCWLFGVEPDVKTEKHDIGDGIMVDDIVIGDLSSYNKPITRSDVCMYASRAYLCGHKYGSLEINANKKEVYDAALSRFTDFNIIPESAKSSIYVLVEAGIINGNDDGSFNPNGYLTRAEATAIIKRLRDSRQVLFNTEQIDLEKMESCGYVYSDNGEELTGTITGKEDAMTAGSFEYTKEEVENIFSSKENIEQNLGYEYTLLTDAQLQKLKESLLKKAK